MRYGDYINFIFKFQFVVLRVKGRHRMSTPFQRKTDRDLFAVIKPSGNHVLGRIIKINRDGLILRSVSDEDIGTAPSMDVFTKGKFFFRDLPVSIISDKKIPDMNSFSKLLIREVVLRFDHLDRDQKSVIDNLVDEGLGVFD